MDNVDYSINLSKEAQLQLTEAIMYYTTINEKLGAKFKSIAIKLIDSLQKDALLYQIRYKEIRIVLLKKFPYSLHYLVKDNQVFILKILHQKMVFA